MDEEYHSPNTLSTTHPLLRSHHTTPPTPSSFSLRLLAAAILADDDDEDDGEEQISGGGESCAYSNPITVLDVIWNLAFVLVSFFVLFSTFHEKPSTPLRAWVSGYAFQCVLHVGFVYFDDRRTRSFSDLLGFPAISLSHRRRTSMMKRLESVNTVVSSIWWMFGFYWTVVGGQSLLQDSPRLYWLTVIFLAFDVFFIVFCVGMAFLIFFALFFCVPVVAFIYSIIVKDGASEDDIRNLPKYRLRQDNDDSSMVHKNNKNQETLRAQFESGSDSYVNEFALSPEDSECCICLCQYADWAELCALPCGHHFHCGCITKWLRMNATCPLCKFNILQSDTLV